MLTPEGPSSNLKAVSAPPLSTPEEFYDDLESVCSTDERVFLLDTLFRDLFQEQNYDSRIHTRPRCPLSLKIPCMTVEGFMHYLSDVLCKPEQLVKGLNNFFKTEPQLRHPVTREPFDYNHIPRACFPAEPLKQLQDHLEASHGSWLHNWKGPTNSEMYSYRQLASLPEDPTGNSTESISALARTFAVARFDYTAKEDNELSFRKWDTIFRLGLADHYTLVWYSDGCDGDFGLFLAYFVELWQQQKTRVGVEMEQLQESALMQIELQNEMLRCLTMIQANAAINAQKIAFANQLVTRAQGIARAGY
ncbi:hypothetical protein G7Y89_g6044 [Cudoniella acicularis]|uniref:DUF7514 domain-containing protein n=1 Tax=Cudoniella acicularis TaxID=354080 RepID=A0A8H4W383_9HELO|nr:hypothetical protein G7Y89_g6044 [Cudoniella acicularis]